MIPPLAEGQQTTLTCTAPGLCSGSVPTITWTWRGTGENNTHITGNITTETLTAVTQRHSSTLTFNPSVEHHGTDVTCQVSFTGDTTTEETVTLNVTYVKEVKVTGITRVKEGETLNLTCSVESFPPSLIMWFKLSDNNMKNGTKDNLQIETLTDPQNSTESVLQSNTGLSTLIISNMTVEHAGRYICTVKHQDISTTVYVDVTVSYVKEVKVTGITRVKEGETLNLTCSVESFPPSLIMWFKLSDNNMKNGTKDNLQIETLTDPQNSTESDLQSNTGLSTLIISNMTVEHAGCYICTVKHLNNTLIQKVDITVIYMKKPRITGDADVKEGDTLNLTCSVESFPPSLITWTKLGLDTNLDNRIDADLQNHTLIISNVTVEHAGRYICTAKHQDISSTVYVNVTVSWFANILNVSGCVTQSTVLTCVCISQGNPLPTIQWPLLENHKEYSVITTVSNYTVNSTITLTAKDHSNTVVECVSNNGNGKAKENITIQMRTTEQEDQSRLLKAVSRLETILAFLIGVFLSATLCCLANKCYRQKQKNSEKLDGTLEMVTTEDDPLRDAGRALEDDQTPTNQQEAAKDGAEATVNGDPDLNSGPKDVEYASIDFSVLKRKSLRGAAKKQETTETEYAEIKREGKVERQDVDVEPDEMLECKEDKAMMGEDEETKHCVPEEEEAEDVALYSNVKDIMGEI
ncbi:hypothetical protein PAMP_002764 [Pampus punctatissimus]